MVPYQPQKLIKIALNHILHDSKDIRDNDKLSAQKTAFVIFMEKEIYEQSVVAETLTYGRIKGNDIVLDELCNVDFTTIDAIKICACEPATPCRPCGKFTCLNA